MTGGVVIESPQNATFTLISLRWESVLYRGVHGLGGREEFLCSSAGGVDE